MHCDQIATVVLWTLIAGVIIWTKVMTPLKAGNFARSYRYENDVMFCASSTNMFLYNLTDLEIIDSYSCNNNYMGKKSHRWSQLRMFIVYDKFAYSMFQPKWAIVN
jgi:hypothetical protein